VYFLVEWRLLGKGSADVEQFGVFLLAPGISLTAGAASEKPHCIPCFHFLLLEWCAPFFSGAYGGSAAMIRVFPEQ
jgi:hypothetical protein